MSKTGNTSIDNKITDFLANVEARNVNEPEFLQAV